MSIQTLFYGDIIWLAFLLTSFMICATKQWKGNKKFSYPQLFSNFLYMAIWLFFSIAYERLGQGTPSERWFISFVPGAYFLGGFLKALNRTLLKISYLRFYFWVYSSSNFLIMELYPYNYRFITKKIGDQIVYSFQ